MDEQQEIIQDFLIESNENLAQLDQDFVELEKKPDDPDLIASIFRTIHTIKGTCGFLGFDKLEKLTHFAENLLSQLRNGEKRLTPELTNLLLESVDAVKAILVRIEHDSEEGDNSYDELRGRLQAACEAGQEAQSEEAESEAEAEPEAEPEAVEEAAEAEAVEQAPAVKTPEPPPAAEVAKAAPPEELIRRSALADSNIRVDVALLDSLMNLVGELVLARNQILQFTETQEDAGFSATSQRLNLITTELQAAVMKTRMQPIRVVWNKFPRVVRDLGQSFGKQIELEMEGAETELDKTIIEAIKDPLTHIVRNSCDHGIEGPETRAAAGKPARGRLLLRAFHEGGQVNIEISDDGAGIDAGKIKRKAVEQGLITAEQAERMGEREALNLIFAAGLSLAAKVTNVSGRGVGMDVVRTNIEKIGGSIDLQSEVGRGTTIRIRIPLTLAIIPALIVSSSGERFAIPQVNLVELVRIEAGRQGRQIELIHGAPVYRLRGKLLPLVYLSEVLGLESVAQRSIDEPVNIVVLQADEKSFGLAVDGVNDTAEIVVKPLGKLLKGIACYAGATIMGDGHVALILDVMGLAQMGGVAGEHCEQARAGQEFESEMEQERQAVLLFRAGSIERLAVPLGLVDRLEEFPAEKIESSGGRRVIQYRGGILPLADLAEHLGAGRSETDSDALQVIVFSEGAKRLGVVVDEILDIVEETVSIRKRSGRSGILGSAVVGGRVTDFVDLHELIESATEGWFGSRPGQEPRGVRVLIAEASAFSRGLMRNCLEMAGYAVLEAADTAEALERLNSRPVDVLVTSLDLPGEGSFELLKAVRGMPELARIPVLGLSSSGEQEAAISDADLRFDDCQPKFDQASMLRSIERLASALECEELVEAGS